MSQFYDQASLVMVPSGYKAGKVYSQKPLSTDGELTFTRNSNATRVNADGLVEKVRTNQFTYSNDFSNAIWAKSNLTVAQVGDAWEVTDNTTSGSHYIYSGITVFPNTQYSVSITAKAGSVDYIAFRLGGFVYAFFNLSTGTLGSVNAAFTNATIESVGNGYYRCTATATTAASGNAIVFYPSDNSSAVAYTGTDSVAITIKDAQAEFSEVATDYIPTTSAAVSVGPTANVPRLNYSNGCPSLLLEPQRSNLAIYSEQLDNAAWTKSGVTVTANQAISPDGYQNADKVTNATVSDFISQIIAGPTATAYAASFYIKNEDSTLTEILVRNSVSSLFGEINWSGSQLVSITGVVNGTLTFEAVGNDWYRIFAYYTSVETIQRVRIFPDKIASGKSVYVWGYQLEQGASYASSYIGPTLGASVTRLADMVGKSAFPTSILNTTTAHSGFFELKPNAIETSGFQVFGFDDNTYSSYIKIYADTTGRHRMAASSGGSSGVSAWGVANQYNKFAWSYDGAGNVKFFCNGVASVNYSITLNAMTYFGAGEKSLQTNYTNQSFKQILLFNSKLTDAQLAELTTL